MDICYKIKQRRKELGLTMLQVAKKIGVSEATVSRWESGDIANMRRDKIVSLANALQVHPSFIMGDDTDSYYNSDKLLLSSDDAAILESNKKRADSSEPPLSDELKAILDSCSKLSDENLQTVLDLCRFLNQKQGS